MKVAPFTALLCVLNGVVFVYFSNAMNVYTHTNTHIHTHAPPNPFFPYIPAVFTFCLHGRDNAETCISSYFDTRN